MFRACVVGRNQDGLLFITFMRRANKHEQRLYFKNLYEGSHKDYVKGQDRLEKTLRKIIKGELAASGHAG